MNDTGGDSLSTTDRIPEAFVPQWTFHCPYRRRAPAAHSVFGYSTSDQRWSVRTTAMRKSWPCAKVGAMPLT